MSLMRITAFVCLVLSFMLLKCCFGDVIVRLQLFRGLRLFRLLPLYSSCRIGAIVLIYGALVFVILVPIIKILIVPMRTNCRSCVLLMKAGSPIALFGIRFVLIASMVRLCRMISFNASSFTMVPRPLAIFRYGRVL